MPPKPKPRLTLESLTAAVQPPNNCQVRKLLDALPPDELEVVEAALAYDAKELPASAFIDWLKTNGVEARLIPHTDHIAGHRGKRRPCRCQS